MTLTNRFQLPLLSPGQAQGSVTANMSFSLIDALMQIVVISRVIGTPPASPANVDAYIVPADATGVWSGKTGYIAIFMNGVWNFIPPFTGMRVYSAADENYYAYNGSSWQPLRLDFWSVLQSANTLSNSNSAQNVFPAGQGSVSLAANTTYEFEALYQIMRSAGTTSHTVAVLFSASQALSAISYLARVTNPTGNVLAAVSDIAGSDAGALTLTAANSAANENLHITLRGIIVTGSSAPTLTPKIQYSAAPGGAPSVAVGSFFRISAIGSNSVTAIGSGWA